MSLPWSDIPVFLAIARNGTLSSAGRALKLDRTTVSRRIESMERKLGHTLFERADGSFVLSGFGRQIFAAAECAEQELSALGTLLRTDAHPSGRLRVSMSEHLLISLADCFKTFAAQNPDILLELTATDRSVDLQHFEADVVLRISRGALGRLEGRNIGKPVFSLFRKTDHPLADCQYIARPSEKTVPKYLRPYLPDAGIILSVDGLVSMREMIARGVGAGILPNYFGARDARIKRCSGAMPSAGFSLYIAFLPEQRRLHRVKTFVDFIERHLGKLEGFERR